MEPRTEAGRRLLLGRPWLGAEHRGILAIEAEALSAYKAELRERVEGLPEPTLGLKGGVARSAVLALLDSPDQETA